MSNEHGYNCQKYHMNVTIICARCSKCYVHWTDTLCWQHITLKIETRLLPLLWNIYLYGYLLVKQGYQINIAYGDTLLFLCSVRPLCTVGDVWYTLGSNGVAGRARLICYSCYERGWSTNRVAASGHLWWATGDRKWGVHFTGSVAEWPDTLAKITSLLPKTTLIKLVLLMATSHL